MEGLIRWSPHSTLNQQRFVLIDPDQVKLCEVETYNRSTLKYKQISHHTKFKGARAFDWSPIHEGLVAVGLPSGEATILRIDDNSNKSYSFPIKNQRWCNSVSLSKKGLLAGGLDKVRNDFCLNIWDADRHLCSSASQASFSSQTQAQIEPIRKLSSSEGVTSVRFFADQPDTLVAGVKGQYLRIFDLRESVGNSSVQYTTRCVNSLAIDSNDENYFASASSQGDATICIWDRRLGNRSSASTLSSGNSSIETAKSGPVLEFKNVIDRANATNATQPSIVSIRFSRTRRGCFGLLSNAGELKIIETVKELDQPKAGGPNTTIDQAGSASLNAPGLYASHTRKLRYPFYHQQRTYSENNRVIAFDFIGGIDPINGQRVVTLSADDDIEVLELQPSASNIDVAPNGVLSVELLDNEQTRAKDRANALLNRERARFVHVKPTHPKDQALAQTIQFVRNKGDDAGVEKSLGTGSVTQSLVHDDTDLPSSWEAHEKLLDSGCSVFKVTAEDALVSTSLHSRRSREGYLFNCDKNICLVADDPWLQDLWVWVQHAEEDAKNGALIYGTIDLSYLGIHDIMNNTLGPHPEARQLSKKSNVNHPSIGSAVKGLNRRADRPSFSGPKTEFPEHRQYCLALCGFALSDEDMKVSMKAWVKEGNHSKVAALALFHDQPKLAMANLSKGTESHKLLAMGIAGYSSSKDASKHEKDEDWAVLCKDVARSLHDPYSRAILTLVSDGDWYAVVQQKSLPLRYRVGVALRHLEDDQLLMLINDLTAEVIRNGDIEGICLTGLGYQAMDLFQKYIVKFGDLQTAILVMSYTSPRFIYDCRFEFWREFYRDIHDSFKMHIHRIQFEKQSARKSATSEGDNVAKPQTPQISVRCNYCSESLALDNQNNSGASAEMDGTAGPAPSDSLTGSNEGGPLGGPGNSSGTICPKCKSHLPRCGVCMMWLGTPDPSTPGGGAAAAEARSKMENFTTFCLKCNHGWHFQHGRAWFAQHRICPVPDCQCNCTRPGR